MLRKILIGRRKPFLKNNLHHEHPVHDVRPAPPEASGRRQAPVSLAGKYAKSV